MPLKTGHTPPDAGSEVLRRPGLIPDKIPTFQTVNSSRSRRPEGARLA
jgi:hypothetical protein